MLISFYAIDSHVRKPDRVKIVPLFSEGIQETWAQGYAG
jgi:hypothetical protein